MRKIDFNISCRNITILVLCGVLISCFSDQNKRLTSYPLNGKLFFVEDIDGRGGVFAHQFGDIVLFDPTNNDKDVLTNDSYFDFGITYMQYDSNIYFESKREAKMLDWGLGAPGRIYTINLTDRKVKILDEINKKIGLRKYDYVSDVSGSDSSLIFSVDGDTRDQTTIYKYSLKSNNIDTLCGTKKKLFKVLISKDETKLFFVFSGRDKLQNVIYDIGSKTGDTLKTLSENCFIEDSRGDSLLILCLNSPTQSPSSQKIVQIYNVKSKQYSTLFKDSSIVVLHGLQFGQNTNMYYLKDYMDGENRKTDVFSYDWKMERTTQLTYDGHQKMELLYIK